MKEFWRFLLRKDLAGDSLYGVHVAVFGLGDSGYPKYNVRRAVWQADVRISVLTGALA